MLWVGPAIFGLTVTSRKVGCKMILKWYSFSEKLQLLRHFTFMHANPFDIKEIMQIISFTLKSSGLELVLPKTGFCDF